jgi:hypothetical protein
MQTELIQTKANEFDIPLGSRPIIDGVGEMDQERFTFNKIGIIPLGIYDEPGMKETTAFLICAYIKKEGLIVASIPFFYRYGSLREHSLSIFKFKADSTLTAFQIWINQIIKSF